MDPENSSDSSHSLIALFGFVALVILIIVTFSPYARTAKAQSAQLQALEANTQTADKSTPEMSSHEEATTFKVNVRLVLVRAVIRDAHGQSIGNLHKEDFQLFDNHKPQVITQFSVEHPGTQVAKEIQTSETQANENPPANNPNVPERFVAYLFDDIHLQAPDLLSVRIAAERDLSNLRPTDRAAIFTTSGHTSVDFTGNHNKLRAGLLRLMPSSLATNGHDCPNVSHYMADQIVNKSDQQALSIIAQEVSHCQLLPQGASQVAQQIAALSAAQRALAAGDSETHLALASLDDVLRRIASMPGQRSVVLVSPGFITPDAEQEVSDVIDRALRANIIVSTLNARGLYVHSVFRGPSPQEAFYEEAEDLANDDVLSTVADSTGGSFFTTTTIWRPVSSRLEKHQPFTMFSGSLLRT
jgi:VWFA-related protein